jgi:hypothetical protein
MEHLLKSLLNKGYHLAGFDLRTRKLQSLLHHPGANPTTSSYNDSIVKIYGVFLGSKLFFVDVKTL